MASPDVVAQLTYQEDDPEEIRYSPGELQRLHAATRLSNLDPAVRRVRQLEAQARALGRQFACVMELSDDAGRLVEPGRFADRVHVASTMYASWKDTRYEATRRTGGTPGRVRLGPQPTDAQVHDACTEFGEFLTRCVDLSSFSHDDLGKVIKACEALEISFHPNGAPNALARKLAAADSRLPVSPVRARLAREGEEPRWAAPDPTTAEPRPVLSPDPRGHAATAATPLHATPVRSVQGPLDQEMHEILLRLSWNPDDPQFAGRVGNLFERYDAAARSRKKNPAVDDPLGLAVRAALSAMRIQSLQHVLRGVSAIRKAAEQPPVATPQRRGFDFWRRPPVRAAAWDPRLDAIEKATRASLLRHFHAEWRERQQLMVQRIDEPVAALAQETLNRRMLRFILGPQCSDGLRREFRDFVQQSGQLPLIDFLEALSVLRRRPAAAGVDALMRTLIVDGSPVHQVLGVDTVALLRSEVVSTQRAALSVDDLLELFEPAGEVIARWLQTCHVSAFAAHLEQAAR